MAVEIITSFDQQCDSAGDPMSGAKVYVYDVGTTTPKTVYSDTALSVSVANPIVCDSAGRHDMRYIATGAYKIVVKTSADVTVYTRDNIDGRVPVGSGALAIANGGTGATSAATALSNLGGATAAELADLAADVASLAGQLSATDKTHIATGTTAQRPVSPIDGDIRFNTTTGFYEGYVSGWNNFSVAANVTTEINATVGAKLIQTQAASSSAQIDFTTGLNDTYDAYEFRITSVSPVTDDADLWLRIGTGGGPTYQTTGYGYIIKQFDTANTDGTANGTGQASILLHSGGDGLSNAAGETFSAVLRFQNPELTSDYVLFRWEAAYIGATGGALHVVSGAGRYGTVGAITGIRFMMSSGNIASGRFSLFGIRKT